MHAACSFGLAARSPALSLGTRNARGVSLKGKGRSGSSLVASAKKKKRESVDAVENVLKWTEEIQKQMTGLRSSLIEVQETQRKGNEETSEGNVSVAILHSLEHMLNQMMDRQDRFFREEREYWLAERTEWKKHESELKKEIAQLHEKLLNQVPPASSTSSEDPTGTADAVAVQPVEEEPNAVKKVNCSINAAISAVDNGNVLSDHYDKLLRLSTNGITDSGKDLTTGQNADAPVETVRSPPTGPPPTLAIGDDDIFWVSQLQAALGQKGYYCGDDDVEDFYFGDGTVSALLTFQACTGLQETGTTDTDTWKALLGPDLKPIIGDALPESTETSSELDPPAAEENEETIGFPVLSEFDGGKEVHYLQVMLEVSGYSCGKEDMMWWHYGDDTIAAMKTFQACNGLPQSGVADASTWEKLVGEGKSMKDVLQIVLREQIYEEDLTNTDRVWLMGEQRWERTL